MQDPHPSGLAAAEIEALRARATVAAEHSYSPYSGFRVGAAILLSIGDEAARHVVTGTNVENASFRLTTCAEQAAIAAAVGLYGPAIRIRAVAVANLNSAASMPCGACRQTILEFAVPKAWVFYPGDDNASEDAALADLLPAAFRLRRP